MRSVEVQQTPTDPLDREKVRVACLHGRVGLDHEGGADLQGQPGQASHVVRVVVEQDGHQVHPLVRGPAGFDEGVQRGDGVVVSAGAAPSPVVQGRVGIVQGYADAPEPGLEEPAEEEEMMMQEVARRVTQRLLDAAKLAKSTK